MRNKKKRHLIKFYTICDLKQNLSKLVIEGIFSSIIHFIHTYRKIKKDTH